MICYEEHKENKSDRTIFKNEDETVVNRFENIQYFSDNSISQR